MLIVFEIKDFSQNVEQRLTSHKNLIHGKYWEISVDLKGDDSPGYISIYLSMHKLSSSWYVNGHGVNYKFALAIIDPVNKVGNVCRAVDDAVYDHKNSGYGCYNFIKFSELINYVSNDTLRIECVIDPEYKNVYVKPSITLNESSSMEDSVLLTDKYDYYPIQKGPYAKGYVCIIRNTQFESSALPTLVAYEADVEHIYNVCATRLAVDDKDIETHHNLSSGKMLEVFDQLRKKDFTSYDYIMIFILSHGYSGSILGTDAIAVPYLHLQQYLYSSNCKSLKDKPKCFFLQGCRLQSSLSSNAAINTSLAPVLPPPTAPVEPTKSTLRVVTKPHNFSEEEADFLFACACVDFSIAWTNTATGSWYITQLCKCLAYFSHSDHLLDMLIKVNQLLYKMNKDVERYGIVSQISVPSHTFTRKFRFFENKENESNKKAKINVSSSVASSSSSSSESPSNKEQRYDMRLRAHKLTPLLPLKK